MEKPINFRKQKKLIITEAYQQFKQTADIHDKNIQDALIDMDEDIIKYHNKLDSFGEDLKNIDNFLLTAGIPFDHEKECFTDEKGITYFLLLFNHHKEEYMKKRIILRIKDCDGEIKETRLADNTKVIDKFKMYPYIKPFLKEIKEKLKEFIGE